jgi:hypothetical protein
VRLALHPVRGAKLFFNQEEIHLGKLPEDKPPTTAILGNRHKRSGLQPMLKQPRSRRDFLQHSTAVIGGAWLGTYSSAILAAVESAGRAMDEQMAMAHLSSAEASTLAAVADQVFPPDDSPGGSELGAVHFIDAALGGFMAGAAAMLREGMADLDERAAKSHGSPFAGLSFEQQTEMLVAIENTPFFRTVHFLTLVGLFAMPGYGGNSDGKAWRLIGFESRHVWQAPYGYYDAEYAKENLHAGS